jgi:hypothetical protein
MKTPFTLTVLAALALAACSGNFGTGTGMPEQNGMPPVGASSIAPNGQTGPQSAQNGALGGTPGPAASPGTYPITGAQSGFACPPMSDGYACTLAFNLPQPTPSPSPGRKHTSASATPSPSPTPTPSPASSGSPGPSASPSSSPTPETTVTLKAEAQPKDAPKMMHVPQDTLDVVPLEMVTLTTNGNFTLDGWATASFTLPQSQISGRGFAVQLFQASSHRKNTSYTPIWTFDKSSIQAQTLTFSFQPPKIKIAKGDSYVLVLYGNDMSKVTPVPSSAASGGASAAPNSSPSLLPSASPSGSPAASPSTASSPT